MAVTSPSLFDGVTSGPARDFVAAVAAADGHLTYWLPCCGRFATAAALCGRGVRPEAIRSSDISFVPSVIGHLADPSKKLEDLGVDLTGGLEGFLDGAKEPLDFAAGYLLAAKYLTFPTSDHYGLHLRRHLWNDRLAHRRRAREHLEKLLGRVSGLSYEVADVRAVAHRAVSAPEAAFFYAHLSRAPEHARGVTADGRLRWSAPECLPLTRKDTQAVLGGLSGVEGLTALAHVRGVKAIPDGWVPLFASPSGGKDNDYVVASRELDERHAALRIKEGAPRLFEIYDDQEITEATEVRFVHVDKFTSAYYRDLFVHRLGSTGARSSFLVLLDGRVITSMGVDDHHLLLGNSEYLFEMFGITKSSIRCKRLGKLFMLLLTSGDTKRFFNKTFRAFQIRDLKGVQTTSITEHEEGKTDRSVMKIVHRERLPTGAFRIVYRADFRKDTWGDCVKLWLQKWGGLRRD